jgi:hypothetical protein
LHVANAQVTPLGDDVEVFTGTRTTSTFGFTDNITLRVSYEQPLPGHTTVRAASQCGNPDHKFDWGQNRRNLKQVWHRALVFVLPSALLALVRSPFFPWFSLHHGVERWVRGLLWRVLSAAQGCHRRGVVVHKGTPPPSK